MKKLICIFMLIAMTVFAGTWTGDAEFGHKYLKNKGAVSESTDYLYLDLSFVERINADFTVGASLTSGGTDPRDPYQELSGEFSTKNFNLNEIYFVYESMLDKTSVEFIGGKFSKNFNSVSQLMWDEDLTFEGWGFGTESYMDGNTVYIDGGLYRLDEFVATKDDPQLAVIQLGMEGTDLGLNYNVFVTSYGYDNIKGYLPLTWSTGTNTLNPLGRYLYDYDAIEFGGTFVKPLNDGTEIGLLGNWIKNNDSDDVAYLIGATYGSPVIVHRGDWRLMVSTRKVETDSVMDCFTDSDFHSGVTNAKGIELDFIYGLGPDVSLDFNYTNSEDNVGLNPAEQTTWRTELLINF